MNGAQFVWLAVLVFFAWIVVQSARAEGARKPLRYPPPTTPAPRRKGRDMKNEVDESFARMEDRLAVVEKNVELLRTATIAQASYWP